MICQEFDRRARSNSAQDDPRDSAGLFLGLLNSDRNTEALELITVAADRHPDISNLWRYKGVVLQKMGYPFGATEACYQRAITLNPETGAYHTLLAKLQFQNMHYDNAVKSFEQAIELGHISASSYVALGRSLVKLGMREQATHAFERALKLDDSSRTRALYNETKRQIAGKDEFVSAQYYDEIFGNTEKYIKSGLDSVYVPVWSAIVEILRKQQLSRIVDLGCGPAQFAEYLKEQINVTYLGVDFSAEAVKMGRMKCPDYDFLKASIFDFDFSKTNHDVLICLEVLEHIPDDIALFKGLPSGSKLIASVPDYDAFGHLRVFPDKASVHARYGDFFEKMIVQNIQTNPRANIWLFTGILK